MFRGAGGAPSPRPVTPRHPAPSPGHPEAPRHSEAGIKYQINMPARANVFLYQKLNK